MKVSLSSGSSALNKFKFSSSRGDFFMINDQIPVRVVLNSNVRVIELVNLLKVGTLKSFNVQINVIRDNNGKEEVKTTMYQCNINAPQMLALKEEPDHVSALVNLLAKRSVDFNNALKESKAVEIVKYSAPRIDKGSKNSVKTFSLAVSLWV